jgi:tetratricopeptide (TPR) repeat protein
LCAAVPRTARAQTPPDDVAQARELFVRASELRDQGDAKGALEKFKAAHALAVNPVTTFELARTYEALGMLEEARSAYESIAVLPVLADETERATAARRDGAKAAEALKSRMTPPAVTTAAPPPAPPAPASPACKEEAPPQLALASFVDDSRQGPETSGNHFGPAAYVGFGIGATGFVVGTILAAATMSKASALSCSSPSCEQSSEDAAHAAKNLGLAATVSYTIAAAGVGLGVADLLLYKHGPSTPAMGLSVHPWIGAGAGGVRGSF